MNKRDIFENNLAAITTMKEVESRGGFATEEEKSTMIRFQGFGGCSEAFYLNKDKTGAKNRWELEAQALAEALTDEEYQEARESVLNAFFTPKAVVDNVFDFLPRISDKRLEIFEPGCGVGNFLSMMPVNFEFNTYTGLEKDNISARIASAIYKESANITIVNEDFSKDTNKNKYDLIIGNPPFGDSKINGKSIHNFFIDKSINMLKPGGILSFVITHYFLDSLNPETRLNIFKKANLLVADRLDDEAFSHLNTDINTDIVMFQRLTAEEESKRSALIKDSPELAKGDIPDKFVYDDDVNWIKSYSPNKHFAKNSAEKIAPINFGYYNSNSVQFIKNGVLCDALDRFGKPTIKTFSYENYQKLGLESDDVIKKFKSENYVHKVNFRNNIIKDMIDFASFRKNRGVVIDDSLSAEKSEEGKDGVLVDSFEVFGVGLDASSEYERLKERSYQTTLLSGSFLALESISVDDEKFKALELESQNSGSNIFKTKIVSTSISGADGFTVGHKHDFYVEPYIPLKKQKGKEVVDTKKLDAVGRYIQLRDTTTTLLDADSNGEPSEDTRVKLNQLYDEYVENFSFLNNKHHKRPFMEDPLVYRVLSLEKDYDKGVSKAVSISSGEEQRNESATKIDLFYKSVVTPLELQDMSNASMEELLDYSLAYNSSCDIDFMVQVSGISAETIADNLISNQSIFFDPENFNYVVKGVYLSGDIRGKIDKLKEFRTSNVTINNYGFEIDVRHNFQSLTNVLPEEIKIHDIDPQLGEGWIPVDIIVDFAYTELFPNLENTDSISIEFLPENGKWVLGHQGDLGFSYFNTDHKQAIDIFSAVINSKSVIVKKTITNEHGTELKVVNQEATAIAQEKANLIKELFGSFIINNPSYIGRLETTYNECFNRFVSPNYNKVGKLLLLGKVSDDVIELRPTQENAISRIINNKATLLDHTVGLSKTFTMVAAAMELKRIGTSKKPLLVVPNHIVDDFAKAFMSLYPQSDILIPPRKVG